MYYPPSPEYTPSAITTIPGQYLLEEEEKEENVHIKFLDPPTSPPPNGDVSSSGPLQLQTASVHPTSDAAIILHPEPSGPPQDMPIPVHISKGIPPELHHPDHSTEDGTEKEGECTDKDDQDIPPVVDASTDEAQTKELPPYPWNDSAFTLQEKLDQVMWESLEPEPNYELYGVNRGDE